MVFAYDIGAVILEKVSIVWYIVLKIDWGFLKFSDPLRPGNFHRFK